MCHTKENKSTKFPTNLGKIQLGHLRLQSKYVVLLIVLHLLYVVGHYVLNTDNIDYHS